jgi:hypothetical protein
MSDDRDQRLREIENLLATRQQLNDWLQKLESAASRTPAGVRDRVRADYRGRLAQVVDQLRGHSDVITSTLQGLQANAKEFEQLRDEEQERLAEAELRHTVGEYGAEEWDRLQKDASGKVRGFDEELGRLGAEIGRLEEVLSLIAPPARPAHVAARPEPAEPPLTLVRDEVAAIEPTPPPPAEVPEAPRFVPRAPRARESGPARTILFPPPREPAASREPAAPAAVDELTFLKSMAIEPRPAAPAQSTAAAVENRAERPSQTVPKTLKCGECGALNRPTEWYCEKCGAELAAV